MTHVPERIATLSPERRELLLRRWRAREQQDVLPQSGRQGQAPPLRAYDRTASTHFPLSFAQQRLWFLDQLEPESTAYLIPRAYQLYGLLDIQCMEKSLEELVRRHESLRTTFIEHAGEVVQVIHPVGIREGLALTLLPVIDLQGLKPEQKEEEAQRRANEEAQRPCDLARGPLLRTYLLRLETQEHVLLLTLHHIISDAWSYEVQVRELSILYRANVSGQSSPLAPLPIQYVDYVLWQRQWLEGEVLQKQLDYWKQQLAGAPPLLNLPTDRPRPAVQTSEGAWQSQLLSSELLERLKSLSQQENATLFMTLLASFQVLLMRYSGQQDVVVGTPIANRMQRELESLIGLFVNTLVIRTDLSGNPTFEQVLQRVREICLGAYAHQDIPFEKVVEELEPERDLSRSPLFQVMFVLKDPLQEPEELAGVSIRPLAVERLANNFDLTLTLVEMEQVRGQAPCLHCTLEYRIDLFEADTIRRMLNHWQTLLQGIVQNPQASISDLPLLTEVEREQLLVRWNATQANYPQDLCVHQLFEQQVEQTPDTIAVAFSDDGACGFTPHLTYQQLNDQANQLAFRLLDEGIGPDRLVGVCVERSLELVIALLAVLKAGGAYVPLDPSYPAERLAWMLKDARSVVVLTQTHLMGALPADHAYICLDVDWEHAMQQPAHNPRSTVVPQNLAYVIYTSGSTGMPKGVQIPHHAVINFLIAMREQPGLRTSDTLLAVTSISFDIAALELFLPLLTGARVVIAGRSVTRDGVQLAHALREHGTTVIQATPSTWRMLLDAGWQARRGMSVLCGGETFPKDLARQLLDLGVVVWNLYGPTETTIWSMLYPVASVENLLPIGRPIANTQIYLLDKNLQPVPIGVTGEVYIGGEGLARGYYRQPDLTAERFVANPFVGTRRDSGLPLSACRLWEGTRLYRTGDLARYSPDGTIEYLGRIDNQVKLRGFRIELGEIEATLRRHPAVQDAVVVLHEEDEERRYLAAYVAKASTPLEPLGEQLRQEELQNYLREQLPDYMVPTFVVELPALPLTLNGKVDRVAIGLAPMMLVVDPMGQAHRLRRPNETLMASYTPLQEVLRQIWQDVLRLPEIGIHENFFKLGGHSLLATRVVARIRQAFQVNLPLRSLFEAPTIGRLSMLIEELMRGAPSSPVPPVGQSLRLRSMQQGMDLPLSFAQERLWFLHQWDKASSWYNVPLAFRLSGPLQVWALQRSLVRVMQRHEVLRTTFEERSGRPVQVITPCGASPRQGPALSVPTVQIPVASNPLVPVIDLRGWVGAEGERQVSELQRLEASRSFDLVSGPLLRMYLLRLHEQEHVLLFTLHHIITDAWSIGVLINEVTTLYQAQVNGEPEPLPELPIQYADYAIFQREWLQGEVLQSQLAYWRKQLAGQSKLSLPTDYHRPAVQTERGASQSHLLPKAVSDRLQRLCQKHDVTPFMLLLSAFQILLMRYTGQIDISVGTPIANRTQAELEGMIGFFVNTLVMRTDLSGNPTFLELLHRVREVCLGAYAHQDIPFEKIVEELEPERDLSRSPLFQVMCVLQNVPVEQVDLANVSIRSLAVETTTSKFDLTLFLTETEQGLSCDLEYNTDLFEAPTMRRMLGHFQTLLQGIAQDPQAHISDLPLLTEAEREQLLVQWNATQANYPQDLCVHQLFEQQVEQTPDAIAVVFDDVACGFTPHLTYQQLNGQANQLAFRLLDEGIGPDKLVGVYMERSLELVIALLAVLKAGGAYVPLDPSYPAERLAWMLKDARSVVVLTQTHLMGALPADHEYTCLDVDWEYAMQEPAHNPRSTVVPQNLAYVIYTSGSTGMPKGVQIPHHAMTNFLTSMRRQLNLTGEETLLAVTPLSFDIAGLELFLPLVAGSRVVLVSREVTRDGERLGLALVEHSATMMQATPSTWRLLRGASVLAHSPVRVLCGGETLPPDLARQLLDLGIAVWNLYGPTETTIWSTAYLVVAVDDPLPIGRPIANTQIYLLDKTLQPVPIGVAGELYIGGEGLARGYYRQPELTAERFIANPWNSEPGERMYRTGDLARYRADGTIEFLGRVDHQVKLRGFRIELGEIEATLQAHPAVQEAVVILRDDGEERQYLVAYVVPALGDGDTRPLQEKQIEQWQTLWQTLYSDTSRMTTYEPDPTFNIIGWNSSYTGLPIPAEEMREQVEQTVARILARHPQRVMEIGFGTGMLLFRIAPHTTSYLASDFSADALTFVQEQLATHPLSQVRLAQERAHEAILVPPESVDAIIINSVVQYFPHITYLLRVLEGALAALPPGGFLFIGDVRNFLLFREYVTSVELYRASDALSRAELRQKVQLRMLEEEELLIDPAFFLALQHELPLVGQVLLQLRRGQTHNELTRYRYDVVIRKEATEEPLGKRTQWEWERTRVTYTHIEEHLREQKPEVLHIRHVPNCRLQADLQAVAWVFGEPGPETVGEWRTEQEESTLIGLDPEELWQLGERLDYEVSISWSTQGSIGECEVLMSRGTQIKSRLQHPRTASPTSLSATRWLSYANNPIIGKMMQTWLPDLRQYLAGQLPQYMIPARFVVLESLPLTPNGKVNRQSLPVPERMVQREEGYVAPQSELEQHLSAIWQEVLGLETQISIYDNFFDLGGHSLLLVQVRSKLEAYLGYEVSVVDLFHYPTIHALSTYLSGRQELQPLLPSLAERVRKRKRTLSTEEWLTNDEGIAIVGVTGRFPGARNLDEFWQNLCNGVESICFFSEEELLASGVERDLIHNPRYVKAHSILDDVEYFDASFFGYSPKEAATMDPQQRLFLECAWEILEQAGYNPDTHEGLIGVYAGQSPSSYLFSNLLANPTLLAETGTFSILVNNANDYLATRTSYKLNLKGPGITIQTACSTSLVAVHMACQGLLRYECDMALAGGASITVPQKTGYLYEEEGILSPDGHCRAFDADAQGTVFGNGVGIVALKRLADARASGDTIYAIIRGSAINNDGAAKVGYTAPSVEGQVNVIAEAIAMSGVEPESISYVETHGTGTALGDPIEIAALTQAFRACSGQAQAGRDKKLQPLRVSTTSSGYCAIGSLKSNLGHLDAAAGVAGLIKTVLALKHSMIPPSLHFHQSNPKIDFAKTPFYVNTHLTEWKRGSTPRRAGVSSFGIGGTNAHVILEEALPIPPCKDNALGLASLDKRPHLVVLSSKTASALETMTEQLATYVKSHPDAHLADIAYTLQIGRKSFPHRRAFVAQDRADMLHLLTTLDSQPVHRFSQYTDFVSSETKQVAFLFPGQGTQYVNMARELYEKEPDFRDQIDTCAKLLVLHLQRDLRDVIYPTTEQGTSLPDEHKALSLHQTDITQPALFVIEYALAQLLMKWGIHPQAMIGHSIGEYVAACLAGVFSLEDALKLVALRGRLMQALPVGAMLSVALPEKDVEELLGVQLALAACNGSNESVVSGPLEAIELLEKHLTEKGISCHRLRTSHAFHSQMMDPILERFRTDVSKIALHSPKIPYISNITGIWITDQEATNPTYWAQHIRYTVRFAEGIQHLLDSPGRVLLEVGPGHALSTLTRRAVAVGMGSAQGTGQGQAPSVPTAPVCDLTEPLILPSLRHPQTQISDRTFLLNTCGRLWCAGVSIDWSQLSAGSQRRRIPLPTYPFERQHYWISPLEAGQVPGKGASLSPTPTPTALAQGHQENASPQPGKEPDLAKWFSVPSWKRSPLLPVPILSEQSEQKDCWLIFIDTLGLGTRLGENLRGREEAVITVKAGTEFRSHRACPDGQAGSGDSWEYTLCPESREDYDTLLKDMNSHGLFPTRIIHLWTVIATDHIPSGLDYFETAQALGFYSLLFLTQALGEQNVEQGSSPQPQEVAVISNNLQEVIGGEMRCPVRATALGVGKVVPSEYPHITFRSIDIVLPGVIRQAQGKGASPLPPPTDEGQLVNQIMAELRTRSSDVVVAYRGSQRWVQCIEPVRLEAIPEEKFPLRQQGVYLITGGLGGIGMALATDLASRVRARLVLMGRTALPAKIRQVKRLEELGAEVLVLEADVTDRGQMQAVISQAREHFGDLHGVIHAAGVPAGGLIQLKTPEMAAEILAPKVKGTLVLESVLKDLPLDFLILCSSLTAIIGALGQVDYCAANTFLDNFAFYHTSQQRVQTISINWDTWQEVGMAVNSLKLYKNTLRQHAEVEKTLLQQGILPQEGIDIFRRIISYRDLSQVIVSTSDILARLRRVESFQFRERQDGDGGLAPPLAASIENQRPNLQTPYVAPQNETQQQIADLWQKLLGIGKIGIHDNFIDLGGHSLLGMQLITRLRETFQVDISLRTLFEEPTVAHLAIVLVQKMAELVDETLLLQDIEDVEHLTDDEAQTFLEVDEVDTKQTGRM